MSLIDKIGKESIYSDEMPRVIADYLKDDCIGEDEINRYWLRAVKYIENYTGLEREKLENKGDVVQAMLAIIADMHDNKQFNGERSYVNELVASILDMHRENLL